MQYSRENPYSSAACAMSRKDVEDGTTGMITGDSLSLFLFVCMEDIPNGAGTNATGTKPNLRIESMLDRANDIQTSSWFVGSSATCELVGAHLGEQVVCVGDIV